MASRLVVALAPLPLLFSFGITPSKLSPTEPTPVRMVASGKYRTYDGSHVPAVQELQIEGDRHLALDLKDVPVCKGYGRQSRRSVREIEELCSEAIVGRGEISVEIAFPEEPLISVTGKLVVFNRGRKPGGADLGAYTYLPAPITAALLFPVQIRRISKGRFGWRARAEIPKIVGGSGSVTSYSVRIGKRFLSATCPRGRLDLRAVSTFVDGTELTERAVRTCTVAEADVRQ